MKTRSKNSREDTTDDENLQYSVRNGHVTNRSQTKKQMSKQYSQKSVVSPEYTGIY